ncbi:oxidoreductase domain-containing protein [Thecamonas trahens ATCC 50062]|uniref:Oxidoreductase domain-containing protein n=1 Tax=Thecamonas trahens ATCC 50062 TaxID=461836 RepID=A0A0L0D494_THETB|nr:oxidoreductase domain-containing protein [Thecamonas trahens ATCC 50062]KNC46113.1 oxidoreductase domain-containing protein [Thecamonas trahens ATCC 50062]|eukprot:XP_013763090.1 oxidoreductase domain-containing protein [Thecamonas trahens ATCC 50062]
MAAENPVNIAVVGVGYWGKNYVRLTSENPLTNLVGMCDMHPPTLEKAKARFPGVPAFSSVDDLLAVPELEAVVIVVPAKYHHGVGMQILNAGKHVLMEKPLAVSVEECKELVAAAEANSVRLLVGHTFLFNSSVAKMKAMVDTHDVGDTHYVYAKRTNLGPVRQDVSALWDLATHDISVFLYLLAGTDVEWVSCTGSSLLPGSDLADVVFVTMGFKDSPVIAHVHASWMDPNKEREIVVVGSKGRVVFEDTAINHPVKVFFKGPDELQEAGDVVDSGHFTDYMFSARKGDVFMPHIDKVEPLGAQMTEFVNAIRTPSADMRSDGHFGHKVVSILNAAESSLQQGGARVTI